MSRPKLEVASWIAGIIGTTVTVLFAIPWGCSSQQAESRPAEAAKPLISNTQGASAAVASPAGTRTESSIARALAAADQIYGTSARNADFQRLALKALRRQEYGAALEAATHIYGTGQKDELLDQVSCYAAYAGSVEVARQAIDKAYGTSTKNRMLARVSDILSTKPGAGPNEAQCKAL